MAGSQIEFFADRADFAFLFERFDEAGSLLFTETLSRVNRENRQLAKAGALLDFVVDHTEPRRVSIFFISPPGLQLIKREVRMRDGSGVKHWIEEMMNPEGMEIVLGGEPGPTMIVPSKLRTNGDTKAAQSLYQRLRKIVKAHATRLDGYYYVMPSALEKLNKGWTLAPTIECSPLLHLPRPSQEGALAEQDAPVACDEVKETGATRRTFEETIVLLQQAGLLSGAGQWRIPASTPQYDDEAPCGISLFRTGVEDMDLSGLEMPRSFLSRSEFVQCDFSDSNLAESNLCWSDFRDVNFTGADLRAADMRNALFERADFTNADLSHADLRHAGLEDCIFAGAKLTGAKLGVALRDHVQLSFGQHVSIDWQEDEGDEAPGG